MIKNSYGMMLGTGFGRPRMNVILVWVGLVVAALVTYLRK